MGAHLQVRGAFEGLPAHTAGLRVGDEVLAIEGRAPTSVKTVEKAIKDARDRRLLTLRVRAPGQVQDRFLEIPGVPACSYSVMTGEDESINAHADGNNVVVNKGMMRFAETDEELALVVAHEIAHNALGHVTQYNAIAGAGMGLGLLADIAAAVAGVDTGLGFMRIGSEMGSLANRVYSPEFERDSDYMALYLLQRAGFEITGAPDFWRRMAAEHPQNIEETFLASHPATAERSAALESAIIEIEDKLARGIPLIPDRK